MAIGLALTFVYILLFTISSAYAVSGELTPLIAAWLPNLIYTPIALEMCIRDSPSAGVKQVLNMLLHTGRSGLTPLRPVPI